MNPFFFGDSKRQLFGAYHPAKTRSTKGAVICYPWAREYLLAYPTLRLLAQRLADSGWHALRFDYSGTGDSAGDALDASWPQWQADVEMAIDELKDIAQVNDVALIGMRLGAPLTATAAAKRRDVSRLVFWDPVVDGRQYLAEMGVAPHRSTAGMDDALGGVLTPRLREELEKIDATDLVSNLPRTLVLSTDERPEAGEQLMSRLQAAGIDGSAAHVPDVQVWREEWGRGGKGLAVNVVSQIVNWLD